MEAACGGHGVRHPEVDRNLLLSFGGGLFGSWWLGDDEAGKGEAKPELIVFTHGGHPAGGWATSASPVGATMGGHQGHREQVPLGIPLASDLREVRLGCPHQGQCVQVPQGHVLAIDPPEVLRRQYLDIGQCIWQSLRFSLQWGHALLRGGSVLGGLWR